MNPEPPPRSRSDVRRHFWVLGFCVAGLIVGLVLVSTGRRAPSPSATTVAPTAAVTTSRPATVLKSLGTFATKDEAIAALRTVNPRTLAAPSTPSSSVGPSTTPTPSRQDVDLSEAGVQRCGQAISMQTSDRSLGERLAERRAVIATTDVYVVSYALPASGTEAAGVRLVLVDARSCRILAAVNR